MSRVAALLLLGLAAAALPRFEQDPRVALAELLFASGFAITTTAVPLLVRGARRSGLMDAPGGRKQHAGRMPLIGGIAVLLGVSLPAVGGPVLAALAADQGYDIPPAVRVHLPGLLSRGSELLGVLGGAAVLLVLGHLDDRRGLTPRTRLVVEIACALLLAALGLRITAYVPWVWAQVLMLVVFVVFVTNAVNFIDNMNGLMAGVVLIATVHLFVLAAATGQLFMAAILLCLAGSLAAFLHWNFPVARIFVGDAGTLSVGFLLAALTVAFTFAEGEVSPRPFVLPLLILAVPLADGLTVVVSRLRRGVHPFTGGRDHLSHRLVARGLSERGAVFVLWLAGFLAGLPIYVLVPVPWPLPVLTFAFLALLLVALGVFERPRDRTESGRG